MLRIRLKRIGRRNDPSFRVVVVDSKRGPKSGYFVEQLGFYNPNTKEKVFNGERILHWIGVGAQVSGTVHNMLVGAGVIDGKKKNVLPRKSPIVKEEKEEVITEKQNDQVVDNNSDMEEAVQDSKINTEETKNEEPAPETAPGGGEKTDSSNTESGS